MLLNANALLVEQIQIASGFVPINLATGANTGDAVSLRNYSGCAVVFFKGAGTAGQDPTITLLQGTDVAFGTTKALNFTRIDKKQGAALTAIGEFTTVTQAAGNTYTHTDLAEQQAIIVIDIKAEMLDADGGYDCIQASVADVGTNSQIGGILYLLYGPKYSKDPLPSAIVD